MSAINHPDYETEVSRLNYTIGYLSNYNQHIINEKSRIDKDVDYGLKHYNSDNAEQFNDLVINKVLQDSLSQKMKNIEKSLLKPYFARVDFIETKDKIQNLYIGKISLLKEDNHEFLILDWRSPIANLYYEGRIGKASYICPEGKVDGEIKLKRQYTIEKAALNEIYDIDITTNDDFLQACLGSSKDNRLKDIVSTIQAEQNKVIRADMWKPLIVQGAAGGGKTTIALHRIAYLLYAFENSLGPKNFMIIAPNRFFLSYISEVLPELGVENVKQTTFEDFAMEFIGKKFNITESHQKLAFIINSTNTHDSNSIINVSKFKSSLNFKDVIENYVKIIESSFIPKEDFAVNSYVIMSAEEIRRLFLEEYKNLPMMKRINEIKKHLTNNLKRKKVSILEDIERYFDDEINDLRFTMKDSDERRRLITKAADTRDSTIESIKKNSIGLVRKYISKITPLSPLEYYKELITDRNLFYTLCKKYIDIDTINIIYQSTSDTISKGIFDLEDIAPIMYIKYLIYGLDENLNIRQTIIDEAQDFSLFQMYVLKKVLSSSSFTILGDLCQGIHYYRGTEDWMSIANNIFGSNCEMLTLEQSYRTTIEIMDAASSIIKSLNDPKLPPAKPVIRHGDPVTVTKFPSFEAIAEDIKDKLSLIEKNNYKSTAIICKTLEQCQNLKKLLKGTKHKLTVLTGKEKDYTGGIVIVPSYLVKGLEFDMVIIADTSSDIYSCEELDLKLLYVAMTRALHKLLIYSSGEPTKLLQNFI